MSLKTAAAPCALLLAAALASPALAQSAPAGPDVTTLDSVIVTGVRNPEDPPVVADARALLSRTPCWASTPGLRCAQPDGRAICGRVFRRHRRPHRLDRGLLPGRGPLGLRRPATDLLIRDRDGPEGPPRRSSR